MRMAQTRLRSAQIRPIPCWVSPPGAWSQRTTFRAEIGARRGLLIAGRSNAISPFDPTIASEEPGASIILGGVESDQKW